MRNNNIKQVMIGDHLSFDDWGVYLAPGWTLTSATPKITTVEIPASDGTLDLSEVLAGEVRYNDRTFTCELIFPPAREEWERLRVEIANYCNGKRMRIVPPDHDGRYLVGRINVRSLSHERGHSTISLQANCEPWLYKRRETVQHITLAPNVPHVGILTNERRRVIPTIETTAPVTMTMGDKVHELSVGLNKHTDFALSEGHNLFKLSSATAAIAIIRYQEASL